MNSFFFKRASVVLVACLLSASAFAIALPTSSQTFVETAKSSFSFVDAVGVNSLPFRNLPGAPWNDPSFCTNIFAPALKDLGITHFRSNIPGALNANTETDHTLIAFKCAQANGLRPLLTVTLKHTNASDPFNVSYTDKPSDVVSVVKYLGVKNIDGVEGVNEYYNTNSDPNWPPILLGYSKQIHDALKADSVTKKVPIVGPSLDGKTLTDPYNALVDYGNMHFYDMPYYVKTNAYFAQNALAQATTYPGKPKMITETGFSDCTGTSASCLSDAGVAKNIGRQLMNYFAQGYKRIYIYQLMDSKDNPTDRDSNYGLLHITTDNIHAVQKPVYAALRNLLYILHDSSHAFTPATLHFSLAGNLANIKHVLLQKADGSFYLAIWQAVDGSQNSAPVPVQLTLEKLATKMTVYDTVASEHPMGKSTANAKSLNLQVPDSVLLVKIEGI